MNALLIDQNDLKDQRLENIKRYGTQAMAYSALQDGIKVFRHPHFNGFIAYSSIWGIDYVLSDPITPKEDMLRATMLFLERNPRAVFCQISQIFASLLSFMGFKINGLGVENIIDLSNFAVKWNNRKCLKSYLSKLGGQGYFVSEYEVDSKEVEDINNEWLSNKQNTKELKFMARPFVGSGQKDVRYFYLLKDERLVGFSTFDPIYSKSNDGKIESYTLQHLRVSNEAPLGSQDFLIVNALFHFKEEGLKKISLGLAPLYQRSQECFEFSKFAENIFKIIYRTSLFYNYRTLGQHKDHYKAQKEQTFVAARNGFTLKQLCGLLKINNLI